MSLINRMLQDLDERQAQTLETDALPEEARVMRPAGGRGRSVGVLIGGVLVLAAVAGGLYVVVGQRPPQAPEAPIMQPVPMAPVASATSSAQVEPPASAAPVAAGAAVSPPPLPAETTVAVLPPNPRLLAETPQPPARSPASASLQLAPALARVPAEAAPERRPVGAVDAMPAVGDSGARNAAAGAPVEAARIEKHAVAPTPAETSETLFRQAQELLTQGRRAEGVAALSELLRRDRSYQPARQLLLNLLLEQRDYAQARSVLRDGLAVAPATNAWRILLARLEVEAGDSEAAWTVLEQGMPYANGNAEYQAFAGTLLQRLNRPAEAVAYYRAALRQSPDNAKWWVGLGGALESSAHQAEANDAYRRAQAIGNLPPELAEFVARKLR